jgi:hypothetical protein
MPSRRAIALSRHALNEAISTGYAQIVASAGALVLARPMQTN